MKLLLWLSLAAAARGFQTAPVVATRQSALNAERFDAANDSAEEQQPSRRTFLSGLALIATTAIIAPSQAAFADDKAPKVLVLGGTGLVGSRVVSTLNGMGIATVATSRNGRDGTVALDFTQDIGDALKSKIKGLASDCTAVVSCVGAIGTANDQVVNAATGVVAVAAKEVGVQNFVYITVAPEVKEFAKDIDFLQSYMAGKTFSRTAVLSTFTSSATLIEPTFIYGGDAFGVNPPRVAGFYGQFIEGLLASPPLRAVEGVMPAGFLKIALEPPVSADAVARAAVAGALGKAPPILDSYDKITQAATLA